MRYNQIILEANYKNKFDLANPLSSKAEFEAGIRKLGATAWKESKPQAGGAVYYMDPKVGIVGFRTPDGGGFKYVLAKEPFMPAKKPGKEAAPTTKAPAAKVEPKAVEQKPEPKKELPPLPTNPKFNEYTSWTEIRELKDAIKQTFGDVPIAYIDAPNLPSLHSYGSGKKNQVIMYYNPETNQPLGRWEWTSSQMVPGRGRVSYGKGNLALKDQSDPKPVEAPKPKAEPQAIAKASPQEMQDVLSRIRSLMKSAMSSGKLGYSSGYTGEWRDIAKEGTGYSFEVRNWGGWQIPVDAELEDGDEQDYDWEELDDEWGAKMQKIVDEIQAKYPNVKVRWTTEEKNYISVEANSRM
jgi:hypothetical protein